jgi:hypothetical protein
VLVVCETCPAIEQLAARYLLDDLADYLVSELAVTSFTDDPETKSSDDVTPNRLAVDPSSSGDRAVALTSHPAPQRFSNLDHRYLPERHRASSASASKAQPNS